MPHSWPLVGRNEELEFVERATNRPGMAGVVVAGTPGVGKTRLVREVLSRADTSGRSTAWAQATRSAGEIPFGAVAQLLPEEMAAAGRQNLLRAAADAIARLSPGGPLLLGVDDAHLLDDHSAALIHLLAETDRCAIVATIRTGEAVPDPITALWKDELAERLELQPLSRSEVDDLLEQALEPPVDAATRHRLWEVTQGNVMFLRELVLGGLESGRLRRDRGAWRWQGAFADVPRLSDVLDERLRTLGADQRAVLEVVAIAEPIALEVLEGLEKSRSIESATRTGLLDISAGASQTVGVSHPLYAEAIRSQTSSTRRRTIYRTLADALDPRAGPGNLLRVATWRLEIGADEDPRLYVTAAREALMRYDYPLAYRLAVAAHGAGAGAESLILVAQALQGQGRFEQADETFAEAERSTKSEALRSEAATARASNLFWHLGRTVEARATLARARSTVRSSEVVDELTAELGSYHVFGGDVRDGLGILEPLLERRSTSERALVLSAMTATFALGISGQARKAQALVDEIIGLVAAESGPFELSSLSNSSVSLGINRYVSMVMEGRLRQASTLAQAAFDESISDGAAIFIGPHAHFLGWMTRTCGQVRTSLDWLRKAVDALDEVDFQRHLSATFGDIAHGEALLGNVAAAEEALARAESERVKSFLIDESFIGLGRAWTSVALGELTRGAEIALEAADRVAEAGQRYFEAACLHDAARLGISTTVVRRMQKLAGSFDGVLVPAYAHHAQALADHDPENLMVVSKEFEEMGALLFAAEAAAVASKIHRREGQKGSMLTAAAKAKALAVRCEGARTPALAHLEFDLPLTRREEEIAFLAAIGLTNREIAERLVVSVRTVDNHLHSAYAKLGVGGRSELAPILLAGREGTE